MAPIGTPGEADGSGVAAGAVSVCRQVGATRLGLDTAGGWILERHEDEPAGAILVGSADQLTTVPTALLVGAGVGDEHGGHRRKARRSGDLGDPVVARRRRLEDGEPLWRVDGRQERRVITVRLVCLVAIVQSELEPRSPDHLVVVGGRAFPDPRP